jgi:hypothetical protein
VTSVKTRHRDLANARGYEVDIPGEDPLSATLGQEVGVAVLITAETERAHTTGRLHSWARKAVEPQHLQTESERYMLGVEQVAGCKPLRPNRCVVLETQEGIVRALHTSLGLSVGVEAFRKVLEGDSDEAKRRATNSAWEIYLHASLT